MDFNKADLKLIREDERRQVLAAFHLVDAEPLAAGTEAEVYLLDETRLLKLYANASRIQHFATLQKLYDSLESRDLPLPNIHQIEQYSNLIAVVETRLEGEPLENLLPGLEGEALRQAESLYLDAAFKLREIEIKRQPETYLLFDENHISSTATQSFETFYADFLAKKIPRVAPFFDIPDFTEKAATLVHAIRTAPPAPLSLVHGDFFPGNLLVDKEFTQVKGIIDFGSFTLFGSYLIDVAGAFGFYKMYHPERKTIRASLLLQVLERLTPDEIPGFFRFLLAHAILTCDLYAPESDPRNDGHFQWAAEIVSDYWSHAIEG